VALGAGQRLRCIRRPDTPRHRRAQEIGALHAAGFLPATAELLIDAEEDKYLRAVLFGVLRDSGR
jgi:hypothetical protein